MTRPWHLPAKLYCLVLGGGGVAACGNGGSTTTSPAAAAMSAVATDLKAVGTAVRGLNDAVGSTC